ncbi:hypothetical protein [Carboxylicivirga taeanensis]|uniref:hypothetical protein n=1 Tax=Carboxylicivirga taeanensis TaxID=1416875 RepID=UPI003F6E0EA9
MKKSFLKYLSYCLVGFLPLTSCEINDPINDLVKTGDKAANVYMEIPLDKVSAGKNVEFYTEYWSEDDQYSKLEIWYSIHMQLNYSLTAPLTNYTFSLDSTELSRELQLIQSFEHSTDNYNAEKYAYVLEDGFPISYTLSPSSISKLLDYDETQIQRYFPQSVIDRFYVGFFETLNYDLLYELLVDKYTMLTDVEFETHYDVQEVEDPNQAGQTIEIKVMKPESAAVLSGMVREIPLQDLVFEPLHLFYNMSFSKSYELKAKFRVVNGLGVQNFSEEKNVTVL